MCVYWKKKKHPWAKGTEKMEREPLRKKGNWERTCVGLALEVGFLWWERLCLSWVPRLFSDAHSIPGSCLMNIQIINWQRVCRNPAEANWSIKKEVLCPSLCLCQCRCLSLDLSVSTCFFLLCPSLPLSHSLCKQLSVSYIHQYITWSFSRLTWITKRLVHQPAWKRWYVYWICKKSLLGISAKD